MRRPSYSHGFTLIELLVVISVIGILMTLLIPGMGMVRKIAKKAITSATISSMGMSLSQFKQDEGVYPPDEDSYRDKFSECLVYYLGGGAVNSKRPYSSDPDDETNHRNKSYFDFKTKHLSDYDGDKWEEFMDPWDHPIVYNVGINGGVKTAPTWRCPGGRPRHRRDSYDMFSVGPDGITGKGDRSQFNYPTCLVNGGRSSFYGFTVDDEWDGLTTAPVTEAPGSLDDIANF